MDPVVMLIVILTVGIWSGVALLTWKSAIQIASGDVTDPLFAVGTESSGAPHSCARRGRSVL
jgi:hypothetical protein